MELIRLYIKQFGGLKDREFLFSPGLNTVFGGNEAGKSTLLACIRFLFYGAKFKKESGALSFKERFLPWQGGPMEAEVEYRFDGREYLLTRRVGARAGKTREAVLLCKTTGEELPAEDIGIRLFGMSDEGFTRTMYLSALTARVDAGKEGELMARLSNLMESGAEEASYQKLDAELKERIAQLTSPRRAGAVIPELESRISELREQMTQALGAAERIERLTHAQRQAKEAYAACEAEKGHWIQVQRTAAQAAAGERYRAAEAAQKAAKEQANAAKQAWEAISFAGLDVAEHMTAQDEAILLRDDTQREAELRTRSLLLTDKRAGAKRLVVAGCLVAVAFAAAGFFLPVLFAGTALGVVLAVYGIVRGNNLRCEQERYERQARELLQDKKEVLERYELASVEEYLQIKREYAARRAQKDNAAYRMELAEAAFAEKKAAADACREEMENRYGNVEAAVAVEPVQNAEQAEERVRQADEKLFSFTAEMARIEQELEALQKSAVSPAAVQEALDDCSEQLSAARREAAAAELAKTVLSEAFETLRCNFAPALAQKTAAVFSALTGGKYGELLVDDSFGVRLKHEIGYADIRNFSSGTIEQLYFALRLGIIETIGVDCPLFLDDPFVLYDDQRLLPAMAFLQSYAAERQVILCTCHSRDVQAAGGTTVAF